MSVFARIKAQTCKLENLRFTPLLKTFVDVAQSLSGNGFGQVTRLVGVNAAKYARVVRNHL